MWRVHRAFAIDGDRKTTTSMAVLRVVCRQIFPFRLCMSDARSCYRDAPQPLRLKVEPSSRLCNFSSSKNWGIRWLYALTPLAALFSNSLTPFIQLEHDDVLWCIGVYADGAQAIVLSDLEQEVLLIAGGPGSGFVAAIQEDPVISRPSEPSPNALSVQWQCARVLRERGYALR